MEPITFDKAKLNKDDRKIYDAMTEAEKAGFEKTWVMIETQKARLLQQKNKAKTRYQREQKALSEKSRKERTHRLIERGAILESLITQPEDFSNDELKVILERILNDKSIREFIEQQRAYLKTQNAESASTVPAEDVLDEDDDILEDLDENLDVFVQDSHISKPLV